MTKQELLEQATLEYKKVGEPTMVDPKPLFGVTAYDLPVFEVTETGATRKTIPFYVVDEGVKGEEQAYLRTKKVIVVEEPVVEGELTE